MPTHRNALHRYLTAAGPQRLLVGISLKLVPFPTAHMAASSGAEAAGAWPGRGRFIAARD